MMNFAIMKSIINEFCINFNSTFRFEPSSSLQKKWESISLKDED